ncbi:ABC transporter D family member 1-like [Curcuma longa]|uniref:ABC transporter D family member 1-like n=1 Tax=Curcuma longa TaxID=136217 RepID=UPI003D9E219D
MTLYAHVGKGPIVVVRERRGERQKLQVLRTALSHRLAKVQGFLFRAAFLQRVPMFLRLIVENLLLCFLQSTLYSTSKYLTGVLALRFRKILTELIHADYFEHMVYYKISNVDDRINNPEQRIASDIPKFCSELSDLILDDLTAVADGLIYTWRLCSYASPKYVLWILAYVLGVGAAIRNFSPPFGKLMSKEQQLEGDYRQLHSRLRTHAESVAFYGGENREASHIWQKFKTLVNHLNVVLHDHWWFGMIQDFLLKYLGATVAVVLIIEPFFSGNLRPDSSTLGRAEMLSNLRYHTSVIISLFQSLGTLSISSRRLNRISGYSDRIHELMMVAKELSANHDRSVQRSASRNYISEANYIEFAGVKVVTPTNNVLVDDLSLKVESGSNLLITETSHILKFKNFEFVYAFQETEPLTHEGMVELLRNVDLEYLLDRYPLEKEINWGDELSLGEQQRLGMARLFYHRPKFAILDECTSAVTTNMEQRFCEKVQAMGTSCITISHRPALVAFHDKVLSLDGEGGWSVHDKSEGLSLPSEASADSITVSDTDRRNDTIAVQRAFFSTGKGNKLTKSKVHSYSSKVVASSPDADEQVRLPVVPQLYKAPKVLPNRVASMFRVLIPSLFDRQGAKLFAVALLVVSRTWISDRIASLNGTSVKYVLEQDKAAFIRLTGISVLQSAANSFVAPTLRHLTARLALGWRIRLTQYLLKNYLKKNAFYKVILFFRFINKSFFQSYAPGLYELINFYQLESLVNCNCNINLDMCKEFFVNLRPIDANENNYKTTVAGRSIDFNPEVIRSFLRLRPSANSFVCFPDVPGPITGTFSHITVNQIHEHYFGVPRNPFIRIFPGTEMSAIHYVWYRIVLDCILPLVTRGRSVVRIPHLIMMYALEQHLDIDIALHVFSVILHYSGVSKGKLYMPFENIITQFIASKGIDISLGTIRPLSKDYDQLGAKHLKLAKIQPHGATLAWKRDIQPGAAQPAEAPEPEEGDDAPTEPTAATSSSSTSLDERISHFEERMEKRFNDLEERIQGYYDHADTYHQEAPPPPPGDDDAGYVVRVT